MRYHATSAGNVPFTPEEEAEMDAEIAVQRPDYSTLVRNSYRARLTGQATTAGKKGDFATATKLLLKASEV